MIAVLQPSSDVRPLAQALPASSPVLHLGIIFDTDYAFHLVDHGPSAEEQGSEQANAFRKLWGEKAELRRFKNGKIVEIIVWDVKNADERAQVPSTVVSHLLKWHFAIGADAIQTRQAEFNALLKVPEEA